MSTAIKIENVSKQYRLGQVGTATISHDLNRWWARIRGKEDPYSQVGQVNQRDKAAEGDYVWALKDINLEVEQGEVLGIIGANGAGKSTLLKIISRITSPTTGRIKAKGRIASLLEVGTGMHPEMTARENIYLNGAILGMRRHEITNKINEIIEFAGCQMYVDTPVKRFSSGMRVRLGFAVAAFLEPEILIVDEVLAVGDCEFQKKALGKLGEVSSSGNRTVIYVSHNLDSVVRLADRCVLVKAGQIAKTGAPAAVTAAYRTPNHGNAEYHVNSELVHPHVSEIRVATSLPDGTQRSGDPIDFNFLIKNVERGQLLTFSFQIVDDTGRNVCHLWLVDQPLVPTEGVLRLRCSLPLVRLFSGKYTLSVWLSDRRTRNMLHAIEGVAGFEVVMRDGLRPSYPFQPFECVYLEDAEWHYADGPTITSLKASSPPSAKFNKTENPV